MNRKREKKRQLGLDIFFILLCAMTTIPFLMLVGISLSEERDVALHGYRLIPEHFTLSAYQYVFDNPKTIIDAYTFTITTSVLGTIIGVVLMSLMAYPLSVRTYKLRRFFSMFLFITMIFNGGMAASYIVNTKYYHMHNSIWVFILPGAVSAWYVILLRTFFQGIPEEITEAAKIDGASHLRIFFTMILPLSKPVLATVALMVLLNRWNDWMTSLLYTNKQEMRTIQYMLQEIMKSIDFIRQMQNVGVSVNVTDIPAETVRMAMAVVAAGPMVAVFPFFQKYFTKGITVGSVKG